MAKGAGGVPVGKGYVTIYPKIDASDFNKSLDKAFSSSAKKAGNSFQNSMGKVASSKPLKPLENSLNSFSLKTISLGTVIGNVVTSSLETIKGLSFDAIERLDAIKQFPKVMSALGYSTEEADKSIKSIQEHLMGLPSTTSDITKFVKGIASAGLPLDKATRLGLGFNDMLLSAGASTYDCSRAFVQFNQMLSAGKVDMQSWRTLTELMPAQLGKISEELLGVGKNHMDLYNALQKGTISWQEFTDAIIKGAEEGGEGFDAFAKTAQDGMGGIGTAIQNLKSRAINGIVEIIDYIGQDEIKNSINDISKSFSELAEGLAPILKPVCDVLLELLKLLPMVLPYVSELLVAFVAFKATTGIIAFVPKLIASFTTASGVLSLLSAVGSGCIAVFGALQKVFALFTMGNVIGLIVAAVAALVWFFTQTKRGREMWAGFIESMSSLWSSFCSGLQKTFEALKFAWKVVCEVFLAFFQLFSIPFIMAWEVIKATVSVVIEVIKALWTGLCTLLAPLFEAGAVVITALISGIQNGFQSAVSLIQSLWTAFCDFFAPAFEVASSIVNATLSALGAIFDTIFNIILTLWTGICDFFAPAFEVASSVVMGAVNAIGAVFNTVSNFIKSIWSAMGNVIKNIGRSIGSFFTSTIPSTVGGAFQRAKDRAIEKFNSMKSTIKGIIDNIVSFFTGANFTFPHIKLPHFSLTGEFDLATLSVPHLSVDWYAKGGIFSSPSVIGVGEAGKEAVLPIDHIKPYFNEAVEQLPQNNNRDLEMLIYWLEQNLGRIIRAYAPTATPREFRRMVSEVK